MKKRDLILAGALLLGMSVQAQEQLFFYGFEDDETSLLGPDSLKIPVDSIKQLQYYKETDGKTDNGQYTLNENWVLFDEPVDTLFYMVNGISPLTTRGDQVTVVDGGEEHAIEFAGFGAKGGEKYLSYKADTVGGASSDCNDYEANIFVRGLPIDDYTSYRLSYYVKASAATGHIQTDVLRGWYNSEKAFSMTGEDGPFVGTKKEFETDRWERVTMMTYYQNDSVANRYMYKAGYWWTNSWAREFDNGETYNFIVQPDTYFVRFSFRGPGVTYFVDDIALTKSWIAGAEYNGEVMRVDFGYDTNMAELCKADPLKSKVLDAKYFALTGKFEGEEYPMPIYAAEYHEDGYLYIWLGEGWTFDMLNDISVSFTNPPAESGLQLVYDGDLYPMALDTNWVNAGKIVPDFKGEAAFSNPEITAVAQKMMPPLVQSVEPEEGSFAIPSETKNINVKFNKEVYIVENATDTEEVGVMAMLKTSGVTEFWAPSAYDEETFTVTFTRPSKYTTPLNGDYEFTVYNMRAVSFAEAGEDYSCIYSFGELGATPEFMARLNFEAYSEGDIVSDIIYDPKTNLADVAVFQGLYTKGLRFGCFNKEGYTPSKGQQKISYKFNVTKAGEWYVNYGTSAVSDGGATTLKVTIVNEAGDEVYQYTQETTDKKPALGGVVEAIDARADKVNFPAVGEYTITFALPDEETKNSAWGGWIAGTKGGRVLYYLEVCNRPSYERGFEFILNFNTVLANAAAFIEETEANVKYTGAILDGLKKLWNDNQDFTKKNTTPSAYSNMTEEFAKQTANVKERIEIVDAYYVAYDATKALVDSMKAIEGYKDLATVAAADASLTEYATLNVVPETNEKLKELTTMFDNETKAINDRCTAIADFQKTLEAALTTLQDNAGSSYAEFDEYKTLQKVYNENKDLAVYTVTDEELAAATTNVNNAYIAINGKVTSIPLLTAQVKALAQLATELQVSWGAVDAEELAEQLAAETEDNQKLAGVYQLAIKGAIEGLYADGSLEQSVDMTNFIQNAGFYTTATDKNLVNKSNQLPGWSIANVNGAYSGSEYNPAGNVLADAANPVKDTYIAMNWNSSVTVSQELANLPAGMYTLDMCYVTEGAYKGYTLVEQFDADDNKIQSDTLYFVESGSWNNHSVIENNQSLDSIAISGVKTKISIVCSTEKWGLFDNIKLTLNEPLADYNYEAAAAASAAAMGEAYTGVNAIVAPSKVEFYNLNGMQVTEPNKGVNIRISTGANGQRVIEKVLVK